MDLHTAREAVDAAYFAGEEPVVRERLGQVGLDAAARTRVVERAAALVGALRADPSPDLMEGFLAEYNLSTDEGVALMCLAEAYLRVPDAPTLDALIRDKIGGADWSKHSGETESLLVNASTWALMLTGRIYREGEAAEAHLVSTLKRMVRRIGEPVVRVAVAQAMRVMGQQFVLGRDIGEALERSAPMVARGYRYSYDMLGEAARTEADARRYFRSYSNAIAAISARAGASFVHDNPGISVKLSALHPRYETLQRERVLAELVPRVGALVEQARNANIGFNIDAEEADRLGLSLEVVEAVLRNADLAGWDGFGIVVQAYSKQCLAVLDWVHCLARTLDRRLAVRLVKGAYWDMEVKNAQALGLDGYPVFTRKASTDVSYLAGARFLFEHADRLYPQFATHNAHTVAAVLELAGEFDGFEFQRLHGMGEALHGQVRARHARRCRIYAPVGVHEDLLAYLVRRLLENGANSSFVHQLLDEEVPVEVLVRDPVAVTAAADPVGHPRIPLPPALYGDARRNARGWNLNNPATAAQVDNALQALRDARWLAQPLVDGRAIEAPAQPVLNPANLDEQVGSVHGAHAAAADRALAAAVRAFPAWRDRAADERAAILERIADAYEEHAIELMAILMREAGKTRLDAVLEVREAVDFCRYYAAQARLTLGDGRRVGRGPFVCISPWNFPLAIFTGQITAALVAGNTVVAKPAEQTPLVAARAVELMFDAGVPAGVLALLPGDGATVGGALTTDARTQGVCFTGSTDTAILIDRALAGAGNARAPLIAETGGLNAMLVDSTALPEAAVRDIVASAFQSAGQRCSALRALFVQRDIAGRLLEMLEGATMELRVGDPWEPATDVGPVIDDEAKRAIDAHCDAMHARMLFRHPMKHAGARGRFAAPAAARLERFAELEREVFGPVLHVIEFDAAHIDSVVDDINAAGFGLTFGLHSRLDDRVESICRRMRVGNLYVNRNQIGAVVGVQPFGGEGLSGTGPKAGGPHYLERFTCAATAPVRLPGVELERTGAAPVPVTDPQLFADAFPRAREAWDARSDRAVVLEAAARRLPAALQGCALGALAAAAPLFGPADALPGPTGEHNHLSLHGRGIALCLGDGSRDGAPQDLVSQVFVALAAGNAVALPAGAAAPVVLAALGDAGLDRALAAVVDAPDVVELVTGFPDLALVACDAPPERARVLRRALAGRSGRRVPLLERADGFALFATERVVSVDTTASGGNASLLTLSEA